ncbi:Putative molybdenum cofactor sulfurase, pyruvate kinase-like, insert domain superfamily [Septoria linicola]|uniref:Molybdenum cofactor sulfurase, pyruvate kinase-like, insert domain superfamily n=1 Tax=Septoria linicola TaxID=215465 RepID=A0A9Q9AX05_9PEZI|nr:Putative molybdenum cofactor sulfurase, pyruvate kinase-like, insert domain superfamily [Septoria linicola]
MKVEKIYVYPVKALRAVELDEVQVTKHGFPHDRRFMMLHVQKGEDGKTTLKNMAVAYYPRSVLLFPSIDTAAGILTITYKPPNGEAKSLDLPLSPFTDDLEVVDVTMHGSPTKAYKMQQQHNDWLSSCYGHEVILVYLGPNYRPVLMSSSPNIQRPSSKITSGGNSSSGWLSSLTSTATSLLSGSTMIPKDEQLLTFNDVAPYLIASSKSMEDVTSRLPASEAQDLDIIKFRPNVIVSGASQPWDEDFWSQITITSSDAQTKIECIHNCGRCKSINIDYKTGEPGANESGQLLKKLQKDRRIDPGVK